MLRKHLALVKSTLETPNDVLRSDDIRAQRAKEVQGCTFDEIYKDLKDIIDKLGSLKLEHLGYHGESDLHKEKVNTIHPTCKDPHDPHANAAIKPGPEPRQEVPISQNDTPDDKWFNSGNVKMLSLCVASPKDVTDFAHSKGNNEEQYLHRAITFAYGNASTGRTELETLPLEDVRILFQHNMTQGKGPYGLKFVRIGVKAEIVDTIVNKCPPNVLVDMQDLSNCSKYTKDGDRFYIFTVNLASADVYFKHADDTVTGVDLAEFLVDASNDANTCAVLSMAFKYNGPKVHDPSSARYRLTFGLVEAAIEGRAVDSLDPRPFGPGKPSMFKYQQRMPGTNEPFGRTVSKGE